MSTITDRFKVLLDGYERRINDLTREVEVPDISASGDVDLMEFG
jgi:hypothetical protein